MTPRDLDILFLLRRHRVLTTDQLAAVFFDNEITARHRLTRLYQLRLLDRFAPRLDKGSAPYHYVLDHAGWLWTSGDDYPDATSKKLKWSPERALSIRHSQRLQHLLGVNDFFCELRREARLHPHRELKTWWSERHCAKAFADLVYPDGFGEWVDAGNEVSFCLEYDRHTETHERLAEKAEQYRDLLKITKPIWVLFAFQSERREVSVRKTLAKFDLPFATASLHVHNRPQNAVWMPLQRPELQRVQLGALGAIPTNLGRRPSLPI